LRNSWLKFFLFFLVKNASETGLLGKKFPNWILIPKFAPQKSDNKITQLLMLEIKIIVTFTLSI